MPRAKVVAAALAFLSYLGIQPPSTAQQLPTHATTKVQPADCTITGTESDDILNGTEGDDVICGLGADDKITGLGGDDQIIGGSGNDREKGGVGDDELHGGKGKDTCRQNQGVGLLYSCERPNPILTCPVAKGTVYNDFGEDRGDHPHQGNDITAKKGEPVLASFPGTTTNSKASGAGLYVTLTRSDGSFTYGMHLSKFADEGDYDTGDVIGYVGSTGNAGDQNHLHFEWHPGGSDAVDPFPFLESVCPDTVA